jgi:hypothetical protein
MKQISAVIHENILDDFSFSQAGKFGWPCPTDHASQVQKKQRENTYFPA